MADAPPTDDALRDDEDAYALSPDAMREIRDAVEQGDAPRLTALMEPLHPADIADLLEQLDQGPRHRLIALYGREFDGEILSELDDSIREDVIGALAPDVLTDAVRELESDDVVDLLEYLDEPTQEAILEVLEASDRVAVERAMAWPDQSAGRLMQREVVTAPERWTVGDAIDHLRASDDLPDQFYHVVLVDPRHRPVGHVTLGKLMAADRVTPLADLVEPSFRTIPATQDEEDVAYAFNQYHLISAPVVDDAGRLVGVITIDDAMIVMNEENEEDLLLLAGVGDESIADRTLQIARQRFPWLLVNLGTAILASVVISQFDEVLAALVALAVLMPIVASMGGNAATQSMTVAVRGLATRDLTGNNALRVLRREVVAAGINGAVFAVIMGVIGTIWFGLPMLGVVLGAAMVINLLVAGLAGVLVPLTLDRLGIDPALASGAFVTTVTDVVGFFAFLGLAAIVLL
ncbi:magnesium transporter [Oceaniovalibus guishaninsula JLT2003]|uniref:Magnesium transporter MgtE n=1 Tax=Oceaniovalibus guishaninsula JLT2003 TaxID=1231392 RepID=K2H8M4_9RHOB|nr:magnesium transporter [Oceaniovalibus guishaninsula]EKE43938.1 magnesium transporter [Oceaniovalibus guishaninsula JLT2003]